MNHNIKCVFFDLDHTLWDYDANADATLLELYQDYRLDLLGIKNPLEFQKQFHRVNLALWDQFDRGLILGAVIREQRFLQILTAFQIHDNDLCKELSDVYLERCPQKEKLMEDAIETLEYLHQKYPLTIITNGFEEIQYTKLRSSGLLPYFDHVITSQKAGFRKPAREIFDYALALNKVQACETVMIGDNLIADIEGAHNASIHSIYYNPLRLSHNTRVGSEIHTLKELSTLL
jgi:YjjG family noncanonical pyrimidine nucleotidase